MLRYGGYHYCTTSFTKALTQVLRNADGYFFCYKSLKCLIYLGSCKTKQWQCLTLEEETEVKVNWLERKSVKHIS